VGQNYGPIFPICGPKYTIVPVCRTGMIIVSIPFPKDDILLHSGDIHGQFAMLSKIMPKI